MFKFSIFLLFVSLLVLDRGFFEKGKFFFNQHNLDSAKYYLSKEVSVNPENAEAFFWRGLVYQESGNMDSAILDYSTAIDLSPKPKYYSNRGIVKMLTGKNSMAIEDYDHALKLDSLFSKAWFNKGIVYNKLNNKEKACRCFNKAYDTGLLFALNFIEESCD